MNRGDEKEKAGQRRTGPDENREQRVPSGQVRHWVGSEELEPADAGKGPSKISGHEEKAREGSSTPVPETSVVRLLWQCKTEEKEGGNEGMNATTNEGAERSIQEVAENEGSHTVKRKWGIPNDVCG